LVGIDVSRDLIDGYLPVDDALVIIPDLAARLREND
jgi:hypothetical protein